MKCPYCAHPESKVVDSRPSDEGASIRRRRECLACHKRFTTYETMESLPLVVIKKDGSRQTFDKSKLLNGMIRACEKRPVPFGKLEEIAKSFDGVDSCYAIQAGREIRIMIKPDVISDDNLVVAAREIVRKIEDEMEYPGQIKVNLIRETRAVDYAK